jgi:hypothetical protein
MHFQEVLGRLAEESRAQGIGLVLVGGWAMNAYGVSRQTLDIDFVCDEKSLAQVGKTLSGCGYQPIYRSDLFAKFRSGEEGLFDIDVLFVSSDTLSLLSSGGMELAVGNVAFRVPRLLDLIAMKLHAMKHNAARRSTKDMSDVVALIVANGVDVRADSFRSLCAKYGSAGIYDTILKEVKA